MWGCASGITRHSLTDLKTDCNTKITEVNSKLTSHKTRQVHTETKLNEHISYNKKLIDGLTKDVGLISPKRLEKELIKGDRILKDAKYFADDCQVII